MHPHRFALLFALLLLVCPLGAFATTYEVGPAKPYTTLGAVPWNTLAPGDSVNIYWQTQPYREKLLIACRGTAQAPIQINGIPNASGQRPVLDGQNATTSSQFEFPYDPIQDTGVVIVWRNSQQAYGYKPGYLLIQGLEMRNAKMANHYTDARGASRTYVEDASALNVVLGEHIIVRNCDFHDSGDGLFVASKGDEASVSRDILIEFCAIHDNGNVGSFLEHNVYTEAIGVVFQFNRLGRLIAGSLGGNLKDRSAGTVVRYNWIEGGQRLLDLMEAQDSASITTLDPSYRQTFVYGNLLLDAPGDADRLVHYGGDSGTTADYRKGMLYFYNNTVLIQRDQSESWRTALLELETNAESADVRNNIVCTQAASVGATPTEFSLMTSNGKAGLGHNWVSPGWLVSPSGSPFSGQITGLANLYGSANNDPGFVSIRQHDLRLRSDSACLDGSWTLAPPCLPAHVVRYECLSPRTAQSRPINGSAPDLGAIEAVFIPLPGLTISPGSVKGGISATGTVTLSAPAPLRGLAVALWSNKAAARVPPSVTIPAGKMKGTFPIMTQNLNRAPDQTATITAYYGGATKRATLQIHH